MALTIQINVVDHWHKSWQLQLVTGFCVSTHCLLHSVWYLLCVNAWFPVRPLGAGIQFESSVEKLGSPTNKENRFRENYVADTDDWCHLAALPSSCSIMLMLLLSLLRLISLTQFPPFTKFTNNFTTICFKQWRRQTKNRKWANTEGKFSVKFGWITTIKVAVLPMNINRSHQSHLFLPTGTCQYIGGSVENFLLVINSTKVVIWT